MGEILNSKTALAFGVVLRRLRKDAGITQEQLGLKAGLQRKYISMLELGENQPSLEALLSIAAGLRIDAVKLVALVVEEIQKRESP